MQRSERGVLLSASDHAPREGYQGDVVVEESQGLDLQVIHGVCIERVEDLLVTRSNGIPAGQAQPKPSREVGVSSETITPRGSVAFLPGLNERSDHCLDR